MCGRVVWVWDAKTQVLVKKLDERVLDDPRIRHVLEKRRYNVPPSSHLPVIVAHGAGGDRRANDESTEKVMASGAAVGRSLGFRGGRGATIDVARWGFPIPKRPNGVFNARIESAAQSPMWRGVLGKSHCVFPLKGFYEWQRGRRSRVPYFVYRSDGEDLLLAALAGWRSGPNGPKLHASIVTCEPNQFVAKLHDRMPVVLEADDLGAWLGADVDEALRLAAPAGDVLAMHQVTPDVGDTKNDEERLMRPMAEQGLGGF